MGHLTSMPVEQSVVLSRFFYLSNVHRRAEDLTRELETLRDDLQVSDDIFLIYPHCTENSLSVFQKMKLHGLLPTPTHLSVSDFI
jgi:hypothetical protein